ncbi:hypothetical protein B6U91_01570 [Candidatus Pacearchaeota archaeon ex4484_71]|nr:MAG: hypothetical protein B6U91_01570 [Candidatus Pacearchaeota archaeon ex4484_71]
MGEMNKRKLSKGVKVLGKIELESPEGILEKHKRIRQNWSSTKLTSLMYGQLEHLEWTLFYDGRTPIGVNRKHLSSIINGFRTLREEYLERGWDTKFFDEEVSDLTAHLKYIPLKN